MARLPALGAWIQRRRRRDLGTGFALGITPVGEQIRIPVDHPKYRLPALQEMPESFFVERVVGEGVKLGGIKFSRQARGGQFDAIGVTLRRRAMRGLGHLERC